MYVLPLLRMPFWFLSSGGWCFAGVVNMWRLQCALQGLLSKKRLSAEDGTKMYLSTYPYCDHASLILDAEQSNEMSGDICLLSASTEPDGKLLALHIDEARVELREARQLISSSYSFYMYEQEALMRFSLVGGVHPNDFMDTDPREKDSVIDLHERYWHHVNSTMLLPDESSEILLRLRRHSEFESTVSVLSGESVYRLNLDSLEKENLFNFGRTAANATCMDCWGPQSIVVCFSSGEVSLMDWRDPSGVLLVNTYAPQRASACRTAQGRFRAAPPRAGILSCCALEDSFRVVCGLGDSCGTVVVTDLRKALTTSLRSKKRGRSSPAEDAWQAVIAGSFSIPTSYPISDMRHCRWDFGTIGMVDTGGSSILTSINSLEDGSMNARKKQSDTLRGVISSFPASSSGSSDGGGIIPHTRSLRCDVSSEGCFLVSTRVTPGYTALLTRQGKRADIQLDSVAHEKIRQEPFVSVAVLGSTVCAQTSSGNALCATLQL
ncbi:hypothetical protein TCDM_08386 [Trypanosoma cruzi Dm28c]|uniref:Uncharacterized protein n=2 Tax=Trypanosoma cruzi TaxID=5693 RepID=V5D8D7_TRYCR|nr:hypothetical protein TCDM_08386 [Trypanosoma cruzi Dm28c]